jgi:predicted histone-like DNA-binding protein
MAYNYRVCKKVDKTKPEKQVKYYAVPVSSKLISVKRLSKIISDRCSLTGSDVVACIDALAHVMEEQIHEGNSVCLKGLGIFWLAASSPGFDTPEECTPSKVFAKRICFLPETDLKKNLANVKFRKIE